jgi:hypothetical protein
MVLFVNCIIKDLVDISQPPGAWQARVLEAALNGVPGIVLDRCST